MQSDLVTGQPPWSLSIPEMQSDVASQDRPALPHVPVPQGVIGLQPGMPPRLIPYTVTACSTPSVSCMQIPSAHHSRGLGHCWLWGLPAANASAGSMQLTHQHVAGGVPPWRQPASGILFTLDLARSLDYCSASTRRNWASLKHSSTGTPSLFRSPDAECGTVMPCIVGTPRAQLRSMS